MIDLSVSRSLVYPVVAQVAYAGKCIETLYIRRVNMDVHVTYCFL